MELASSQTKTVLIIDDELSFRDLFDLVLSREGFNILTAKTGEAALEMLESKLHPRKIDLIMLDLLLPGKGGYDVLKSLQKSEFKDVFVYVVSAGMNDPDMIEKIRKENNVVGFLKKPFDTRAFVQEIHGILKTKSVREGA
jgi:DNA-binding response OmpR family regulator